MDFVEAKGGKIGNNLMIVDGLNLAFRYKFANTKNYTSKYINTVQSLGNSYEAKDIIVLGDAGSSYREGIYPEYKANRKALKETQSEEEATTFREFLDEFNKMFSLIGEQYATFRFSGVEADDIAAYLVREYKKDYDHIWLISSDKDWDLLIDTNVSRFSFVTRKEISLLNWNTHYDYAPSEHISIKVLTGDKGDNVPGVPGIGIKRAMSLIQEFGSAYDIYSNLPLNRKQKFIQSLNEFNKQILLNYELMDLETYCNDAIGRDNIDIIKREFIND